MGLYEAFIIDVNLSSKKGGMKIGMKGHPEGALHDQEGPEDPPESGGWQDLFLPRQGIYLLWEYPVFERLGRCHFGNEKTGREYLGRATASAVVLI